MSTDSEILITHPVARKNYQCSVCGKTIPAGTRYWRTFQENVSDDKEHTNCVAEKYPEWVEKPR